MKSQTYQRIPAFVVDSDLKRWPSLQQRALWILKQLAFRRREAFQFLQRHNGQRGRHLAIKLEPNSFAFLVLDLKIEPPANGIDLYLRRHAQPPIPWGLTTPAVEQA